MNDSKLAKLEAEIRRLVPRLQSCSKGCRFSDGYEWEIIKAEYSMPFEQSFSAIDNTGRVKHFVLNWKKDVKIIGHPIDLEAVLEAMFNANNWVFFNHGTGLLWKWIYGKPLNEQSADTIDFLFSVFFSE